MAEYDDLDDATLQQMVSGMINLSGSLWTWVRKIV